MEHSYYSDIMGARWRSWEVTGISQLKLITYPGDWPDIHRLLAMARILMPLVQKIQVYDGKYFRDYAETSTGWLQVDQG